MKLCQGQTWKLNEQYIRLTHLERLSVEYKIMTDLRTKEGVRHKVTKKEFCRLVKNAALLSPQEIVSLAMPQAIEALPSSS